jgi:hypothetical protein
VTPLDPLSPSARTLTSDNSACSNVFATSYLICSVPDTEDYKLPVALFSPIEGGPFLIFSLRIPIQRINREQNICIMQIYYDVLKLLSYSVPRHLTVLEGDPKK